MVCDEGIRMRISKIVDSIDDRKLDEMLKILYTAIDDSDKIDEIN